LQVFDLAFQAEQLYGRPQDVEWTIRENRLYALQSRPITTISKPEPQDDRRQWDLSLRRSYENLKLLRHTIEKAYIPEMIAEAIRLANPNLTSLSDEELAQEIEHRSNIFKRWTDIYWEDFIPFAHGIGCSDRCIMTRYTRGIPINLCNSCK
jgi:rifampicin phosphotransferase